MDLNGVLIMTNGSTFYHHRLHSALDMMEKTESFFFITGNAISVLVYKDANIIFAPQTYFSWQPKHH